MIKTGDYVTVDGYRGVAWYVQGHDKIWVHDRVWDFWEDTPEDDRTDDNWGKSPFGAWFDDEENGEFVDGENWVVTMVGDDRKFEFEESELTLLPEENFCGGCGQIGCGHG